MPLCANPSCRKPFELDQRAKDRKPKQFCNAACYVGAPGCRLSAAFAARKQRALQRWKAKFKAEFGPMTAREAEIARFAWNRARRLAYDKGFNRALWLCGRGTSGKTKAVA